jgi:hypothetical protein
MSGKKQTAQPDGLAQAETAERNSVRQARSRKRTDPALSADVSSPTSKRVRERSSIGLTRNRTAARDSATVGQSPSNTPNEQRDEHRTAKAETGKAPDSVGPTVAVPEDRSTVPDHVRRRFIQVGRKYHFPDGARAFTDRGLRLTTPSENAEVIRSLIAIAQARGWSQITVRGSDRFRREAWFAARLIGLDVRGYRPTEVEQACLARTIAGRTAGSEDIKGSTSGRDPPRTGRGAAASIKRNRATQERLTGRLIEHERATFRHDPKEPMSYYVKLETSRGERVIWGVDLERALKEAITKPQVGDVVELRSPNSERVTVRATARNREGKVVGETAVEAQRNRWVVEKPEFFSNREKVADAVSDANVNARGAVRAHPELIGTYLQIRAAELAAKKKISDPQDQRAFVSEVRSTLAESIRHGAPIPRMKMRVKAPSRATAKSRDERDREQAPARG